MNNLYNYKKIYIERLFPDVIENKLFHKLKIDYESIIYITIPQHAEIITNIVINHLKKNNLKSSDISITDGFAGVGGDTISFARKFKEVISIEIDKTRYNYLSNNVGAYKLNNVILYCDDIMKIVPLIDHHDIIFMDPPWGGKSYKDTELLRLNIDSENIETCCSIFFDKMKMICSPKFIILKLPPNYDTLYLKDKLEDIADIDIYNLHKMIIVVLTKKNII